MFSKQLVSAVAALSLASGALAAVNCTGPTATITAAADVTSLASCSEVSGSVVIAPSAGNSIELSGVETIDGDLIVLNNGNLVSFSSSSLTTIKGTFQMHNVTILNSLTMSELSSVGAIDWQTLNALGSLNFATGISTAKSVMIADTFLSSLDGINVVSLQDMNINNNRYLTTLDLPLTNLSDLLNINANGMNLSVSMPDLKWIANMTISNVTSFSCPGLATVNGSMRFDSNYFTSFSAPNLTAVQTGDVSFVSCPDMTNITMPQLKTVGGGFTIANNTGLGSIDGFGSLESVGGAVALRGSFDDVELPKLDDVKGAFDCTSTGNISSSCAVFNKLSSNGGNGAIQGAYSCSSDNQNANNNTVGGGTTSGGTSSTSGSGNTKSAASAQTISITTVVGLASIGALFVAFL